MAGPWIAVDWGTTNRRVYLLSAAGEVVATERDDHGVLGIGPDGFTAEAAALRSRFGDLPMLCAGMVGSNRGWVELPYASCPATLDDVAAGAVWVEPGRTAILPGVMTIDGDRCDVMRGEEVQLLGAVAGGAAPADALLCQPGTHCKWAWIAGERIDRFVTAMTGELYALIARHSLLATQMTGEAAGGADFESGVDDSADGDLFARLFNVRADRVSGRRRIGDANSYVSGLLIGADVRARIAPGDAVHVVADGPLGPLYAAAIRRIGGVATIVDGNAAFVAGITRIRSLIA